MERWERQKQVYRLLVNEWFSCRELADVLDLLLTTADSLLRHYHNNGHLKRKKINGRYRYTLSKKGLEHFKDFLESGKYLEYVEWYNETNIEEKQPLDKLKEDYLAILELKNKK